MARDYFVAEVERWCFESEEEEQNGRVRRTRKILDSRETMAINWRVKIRLECHLLSADPHSRERAAARPGTAIEC